MKSLQNLGHLTLKHRETPGCVVTTVATVALVLKHQAISILSTDQYIQFIGPVSYENIRLWLEKNSEIKLHIEKNDPVV